MSGVQTVSVKVRSWYKGVFPRPVRTAIPGFMGDSNRHDGGARPQPWHCTPFVEGSTYCLELVYPFDNETRVTFDGKDIRFEGDFSGEAPWAPATPEKAPPPFASFAPGHYGFTSSLDIMPPPGHVVRLEPHPRYYTDETGTVPLAIAGHLQEWWPRIFFVVFKAPWPGQTHVFRKGDPYAAALILPHRVRYDVQPMTEAEAKAREALSHRIAHLAPQIATHSFRSDAGHLFDNKYKVLARAFAKGGLKAVERVVERAAEDSAAGRMRGKLVRYKRRNRSSRGGA